MHACNSSALLWESNVYPGTAAMYLSEHDHKAHTMSKYWHVIGVAQAITQSGKVVTCQVWIWQTRLPHVGLSDCQAAGG